MEQSEKRSFDFWEVGGVGEAFKIRASTSSATDLESSTNNIAQPPI
jgi:hypothetical protein